MAIFRYNGDSSFGAPPSRVSHGPMPPCQTRRRRMFAAAASLAIAGALLASDGVSVANDDASPFILPHTLLRSQSRRASRKLSTLAPNNADLPSHLENNLAGVSIDHRRDHGSPFYWHILKSGGTTVKDIFSTCYGMVEANEVGTTEGHDQDKTLEVFDISGARYVNVDTTTLSGIEKAKRLRLVESKKAHVIISPLINEATAELFTPEIPGKMFAIFRDPVERVVSLFHYLQIATWEPTYNADYANMTIEEYANSTLVESNWMVRTLVSNPNAAITSHDIELAKEIINSKCLVGMLDNLKESFDRFDKYFGFGPVEGFADHEGAEKCKEKLMNGGGSNSNKGKRSPLDPKGEAMRLLRMKNWADIILYDYIKTLWDAQRGWFEDVQVKADR